MPYKSKAQMAYMHIHHPKIAARWDKEYESSDNLPEHVKHRNFRNIPDGDTYDFYDESSDVPFVGPDVASTDSRWTSDIEPHDLGYTSAGITIRGEDVTTRFTSDTGYDAGSGSLGV